MTTLMTLILAVQLLCALVMIGLILIQHGKGADMGAAFGGGSAGSLFGASGSANFLSRSTAVLATVFFVCTLALAYLSNQAPQAPSGSVLEQPVPTPAQQIPGTGPASVPSPAPGSNAAPGQAAPAPSSDASVPPPSGSAAPAQGADQIPSK